MDLRAYYKKVREIEGTLPQPFVVMVSIETPDGGKADVLTEVATLTAAKHIAEGRSRAATLEESRSFHERNQAAKVAADQLAAVAKMHVVIVPAKSGLQGSKE